MRRQRAAGDPFRTAEIRPPTKEVDGVPRYIVERVFPEGFELPPGQAGVEVCRGVVGVNEDLGVTWVHSYVRDDRRSTYCVYDAPGPEAIRRAAERNGLPVERITRVMVLDPYFYTPSPADDGVAVPAPASAGAAATGRRASVESSTAHRQNDR